MSYVRTLLAKLGFEVDPRPLDDFNESIDGSKGLLDGLKGKASSALDQLAKFNQVLELGAKVAGSAWGIFKELTTSVAAQGAALSDTSAQVGVNTTELQRLQYAAEMTGSSADTVNKALLEQSKIMREGSMNATAPFNLALKEIGLNLADIEHLDPAARFGTIGEALGKVKDQGRQSALSLALFGGEGAKILPLALEGTAGIRALGDEAERLGFVLGADVVESGADFDDTLVKLNKSVEGIKNEIGAALMPTIAELTGELATWIANNKELIAENVRGFIEGLIAAGKTLGPVIMTAAKAVMGLVDALGGASNVAGPVVAGLGAMKLAAMASLGPWGLLAGAAVTAGVAIVNWMGKAKTATLDANRAAMRLTETLRFEAHLEEMSVQDLEKKKAEIAAAREKNKTLQGDVRGLSPREILRQEAERKADVEMLENNEQALDKVLRRKKGENKKASDSKYAEAADARKAVDDKERAAYDAESQRVADMEEMRALRRKGGKSQADRDRLAELQKSLGVKGGGGGGAKAKPGDKQASADELIAGLAGTKGEGVLGGPDSPGMGTKIQNVVITINQEVKNGPFNLPGYAASSPENYGRAAGAQIGTELDAQNQRLATYLQNPRSGA